MLRAHRPRYQSALMSAEPSHRSQGQDPEQDQDQDQDQDQAQDQAQGQDPHAASSAAKSKSDRAQRSRPLCLSIADGKLSIQLGNATATQRLGRLLAADAQGGDLIALQGPLGAGKTCLVTGIARGLGIKEPITSPSFALLNQHRGRLMLYHVDLYRLHGAADLAELGLWEAAESGGLLVIEWLDRFPDAVAADRLQIRVDFLPAGSRGRKVEITAGGPRSRARISQLSRRLSS